MDPYRDYCLSQPVPISDTKFCPPLYDELQICWNYTLAGTTARQPCPAFPGFKINESATRYCESDGNWYIDKELNRTWSNLEACIEKATHLDIIHIFYAGYSLSVLCLSLSLFIFFYFKKLQCERILIHKHLFCSYLINAIVWMTYLTVISHESSAMITNAYYCQILYVLATFFSISNYFWTFSEGLYLATILVMALQEGSRKLVLTCMMFGWGVPFILTIIYAAMRFFLENPTRCWIMKTKMIMILTIPNTLALIADLAIVIIILKIVVTKLWHSVNQEQKQWRKTARAIFILFPVMGIQNVLFFIAPEDRGVALIQDYITSILNSFQGVIVSFILCFTNNEVRKAIWSRNRTNRRNHIHSLLGRRSMTKVPESYESNVKLRHKTDSE